MAEPSTVGASSVRLRLRLHLGLVVPALPVLNNVSPRVNNFQILWPIVVLHPIAMMHVLCRQKGTSKHLLSHNSMLPSVTPVVPHADVSLLILPRHT